MSEPEVGKLSPAARGIWMDLLCVMEQSNQAGGVCGYVDQLARVTRCSRDEMASALNEFEMVNTGDVQRHDDGRVTVINRRMAREAKELEDNRLRQQRFRERQAGNATVTADVTSPLKKQVQGTSSDKASQPGSGERGKGLTARQREVVKFAEETLNGQWVNDAGKWVNRTKGDAEKVFRVMADVRAAVIEGRLRTTPAQMAETNWKVFA